MKNILDIRALRYQNQIRSFLGMFSLFKP